MTFIETPRFPDDISYGSEGGPLFSTQKVVTRSGHAVVNQNWEYPLHTYNVLPGIRTVTGLEAVRDFFYSMAGQPHGFRYKDWSDFKSCSVTGTPATDDQILGTGDGTTADYQLIKTYTKGALSMERLIQKPVSGTTVIEVGGTPATGGWTLATDKGVVTFGTGNIPATGAVVKAGYQFDVPVAFGTDYFNVVIQTAQHPSCALVFNIDSLPLEERRLSFAT